MRKPAAQKQAPKKTGDTADTFLRYGIPSNVAAKFVQRRITVAMLRTGSVAFYRNLGLEKGLVKFVKGAITRKPIDETIVQSLLEDANFVCCVCHGTNGKSYLLHHIEEYSVSQDNSYDNLAVLCPTCHDNAHRVPGLTRSLTPEQIRKCREKWRVQVAAANREAAAKAFEIETIDFVNIPRVIELAQKVLGHLPMTSVFHQVLRSKQIHEDGTPNFPYIKKHLSNGKDFQFHFYLSQGFAWHYGEIFKQTMRRLQFENLDSFLSPTFLKENQIIGRFCFYVGGLYGKTPDFPVTSTSPLTYLHLRRRQFRVEWKVDPNYICSMTAMMRISEHAVYAVYGVVRNVQIQTEAGKKLIKIDVRPFVFGPPNFGFQRDRPAIGYRDMMFDGEPFDNQDYGPEM